MKPSVVLVREWEQQLSGSGCCGRLEGDWLDGTGARLFAERREIMERMGPVYQEIKRHYGTTVEVLVIDPRNQISLMSRLLCDFWRYRVGFREALKTLTGLSTITVVVNGRLFARQAWPQPTALLSHLEHLVNEAKSQDASF